jgi:hypothetical protein
MIATANATKHPSGSGRRSSRRRRSRARRPRRRARTRRSSTSRSSTRFKKIYANQQQEIKNDPMTFAARQGLIRDDDRRAADRLLRAGQAREQLRGALRPRARDAGSRYQAPAKPLTKEEADALSGMLKAAPVGQKSRRSSPSSRTPPAATSTATRR